MIDAEWIINTARSIIVDKEVQPMLFISYKDDDGFLYNECSSAIYEYRGENRKTREICFREETMNNE